MAHLHDTAGRFELLRDSLHLVRDRRDDFGGQSNGERGGVDLGGSKFVLLESMCGEERRAAGAAEQADEMPQLGRRAHVRTAFRREGVLERRTSSAATATRSAFHCFAVKTRPVRANERVSSFSSWRPIGVG